MDWEVCCTGMFDCYGLALQGINLSIPPGYIIMIHSSRELCLGVVYAHLKVPYTLCTISISQTHIIDHIFINLPLIGARAANSDYYLPLFPSNYMGLIPDRFSAMIIRFYFIHFINDIDDPETAGDETWVLLTRFPPKNLLNWSLWLIISIIGV